MSLSSNALFHFTDSVHNLLDILTHEFRPHYSLEDFGLVWGEQEDPVAFPLVSFCDIPLSQASKHMVTYGSYALGLDKNWGMRNGVAPVLYCYKNATSIRGISGIGKRLTTHAKDKEALTSDLTEFSELATFIKLYEGAFIRRGRVIPNVRFYDEREWRFVPGEIHNLPILSKEEYLNFNELKKANDEARETHALKFEPSDIKYVVV